MDSVSIAAEILQNPQALPEMLERAAGEVETALAATENMPAAVWAMADICEFLEGLCEGIAFAAERGSPIAGIFVRCFNESANVPCLRTAARDLRRVSGPTPTARRFPDAAKDFAEFLRRWLRVQALLTAPTLPHVETQRQQQLERDEPSTGNPFELSKHRSPSEFQRILADSGKPSSESTWRTICKNYPDDVRGSCRSRAISRRLAERLGIVDSLPEFGNATRK